MAILKSIWTRGTSKKLGGTVIYQAMGQTRQRELAAEVSNPRTESQMNQRVKWANLVNFYRANKSWMKYAFETKTPNQSEYNKFMSVNVTNSPIFLTKQEASLGACVCAPYVITQGSLPSIEIQSFVGEWQTNLFLSEATKIDVGVSVATLSQDLLQQNPGLREGDQLSFIRITQQINANTGVPYIIVRKFEMLLDLQEQRPWNDFLPSDVIGASTTGTQDLIAVSSSGNAGGFAFILSRTISGKTYVSSQSIVPVDNETVIQQYSSSAQLASAIASYGESDDAFLSTVSADVNSQAGVFLSILYVYINGVSHNAGTRWGGFTPDTTNPYNMHFSGAVTGTPAAMMIQTNQRIISLEEVAIYQGNLIGRVPSDVPALENEAVWYIKAVIDGTIYTIPFEIKREDFNVSE